jgi:hypothetical protein
MLHQLHWDVALMLRQFVNDVLPLMWKETIMAYFNL